MRTKTRHSILVTSVLAAALALASGASLAQQVVNLTAGPAATTLPDGSTVPMWGYTCGATVTGSTATCAALNPNALAPTGSTPWSPVVITVPTTRDTNGNPQPVALTVTLTNNLSFTAGTAPNTAVNNIPTSLVIVGQVGGGLGGGGTNTPSPQHVPQSVTWAVAGNSQSTFTGPDGNPATVQFVPPPQPGRVQSFGTEVVVGTPQTLTWGNLLPGTYLLESGTHPSIQGPMGLYGIVVVTATPVPASGATTSGTQGAAYTGVYYDSEVPVSLSEIDPVQNAAVNTAVTSVGFSETAVIALGNKSVVTSVGVNAGGSGYKVGDPLNITGGGGKGAAASVATVDPSGAILTILVNNGGSGYTSVPNAVVNSGSGTGASVSASIANVSAGDSCVDTTGKAAVCYPPAVNYNPLYFTMNGVAFDKTNAAASTFPALPAIASPTLTGSTTGGNVLVRLVNAGLRMHVPAIVGSLTGATPVGGFTLIAEDGNLLPGVPRVQSEVFMSAGKTYDVMINGPTTAGAPAFPLYDRQLSLSGNAVNRDAGMIAYLGVNGGTAPTSGTTASAQANPDTYSSVIAAKTFVVSDPSKGVIDRKSVV